MELPLVLREGAFKVANQQTTPTPRKLALSLLTASALASASLELAIAGDCVILQHSTTAGATSKRVECTGSFSSSEFQSKLETAGKSANSGLFFIGTSGGGTSIGAGSVTINLGNIGTAQYDYSFQFYGLNAPNTTFTFTGTHASKPLGILMPYSEAGGSHGANGSTLFGLTLDTNVNYSSYGVANVYGKALGLSIHGGTQIGRVDERSGEYQGGLTINAGKTVNAMAIYGGFAGTDRSTFVSKITNNGTITELNLGWKEYAQDFASVLGLYNISGSGTITTLNVYQSTLTINSNPSTWNNHTHSTNLYPEHISANTITTVGEVGPGAIRINIGEGVTDANNTYLYEKLIIDSTGGKQITNPDGTKYPNFSHLSAGLGTALHDMGNGFRVSPDIATSYGSSMWRLLTLSYARRSIMVQNIIDTMTTKTFHSDRYYNQEVELRLLQYDMSRLTNRSSKFAKQTRKNQKKVDKMRDKLAKLTLEQSKGQNLDKGYNNFELIDQLDAIFIPYTGRRDWRVFLVPYAAHSYAELGIADATEWAGGAVAGVQRNLKGQGILSTYLTYEYAHATTEMLSAEAIMQTNSLQGGLSYFKIFPITGKVWEATLKASGRVGVDMPLLSAQSPVPNIKFNLVSNKKGLDTPLMWSLGAEVRGGLTFYQFKQNSYVSPEVGLSYDVLSPLDMKLEKAKYQLGGNEYYPSQYWHLPQLSASVKYYKVYGNMFRTNFVAGLRYNMLNTPTAKFKIGGLSGEGKIALPAVYGYLDLDLIWVVKKNHELSAGYNGVFYANKFGKDVMDKFNGVSTSINFKYAHWFGGTDYVKDADGNAISRSVAEGKSKKSKKSKSKKSKKSKKKVYYIDG